MKMKIISLYSNLNNVGGAQKVSIEIHKGLLDLDEAHTGYFSSFDSYSMINSKFKKLIPKKRYLKFNPIELIIKNPDAIFLSHHRKMTTLLFLVGKLLFKKIKLIHVAHNEFSSLKRVSFFPKNIIAVSQGVKKNHEKYFNLKNIKVIYNGVNNPKERNSKKLLKQTIKILLPGRVTDVKQQVEIVNNLKGKIPKQIKILFAGDGPKLYLLKKEIGNNKSFQVLGYVPNMNILYKEVDFVLLFSIKEGLPLSLIEAQSFGVPIICNDVGGNLEILQNKKNGYLVSSFESLNETFQELLHLSQDNYNELKINSSKTFIEKFSYNQMIQTYYSYIEERCLKT